MVEIPSILDATQLFPSEMLPDMMNDHLNSTQASDLWLTCDQNGEICGFCYAAPEALTDGTWNMLAIAVSPAHQGQGCGKAIVAALEKTLQQHSVRLLIADTSGTADFAAARAFYRAAGYQQEASIRDYWAAGDDKITFTKALNL